MRVKRVVKYYIYVVGAEIEEQYSERSGAGNDHGSDELRLDTKQRPDVS